MNANQPAFPGHGWSSNPEVVARMEAQKGLTKREYFAAMAMQGMIAAGYLASGKVAEWSAIEAGALLAALEKEEKP